MSEESKIRDTAEVVKGIVEAVPVYQDLIQPAAKEVGGALQTVAKTIHLALAPVSALVWGYDQIKQYLDAALTAKFKEFPPQRIISPDLNVAGPAVEAMRFAAHNSSLRDMYTNLLATAMDSECARNAHPAFVDFIRQMTADEGRVLRVLSSKFLFPLFEIRAVRANGNTTVVQTRHDFLAHEANCLHTKLIPSYLNNLQRLGLVIISEKKPETIRVVLRASDGHEVLEQPSSSEYYSGMNASKTCELILQDDKVKYLYGRYQSWSSRDNLQLTGFDVEGEKLSLTQLGQQFYDACIS